MMPNNQYTQNLGYQPQAQVQQAAVGYSQQQTASSSVQPQQLSGHALQMPFAMMPPAQQQQQQQQPSQQQQQQQPPLPQQQQQQPSTSSYLPIPSALPIYNASAQNMLKQMQDNGGLTVISNEAPISRSIVNFEKSFIMTLQEAQNLVYTSTDLKDFELIQSMNVADDNSLDLFYLKQELFTHKLTKLDAIHKRYEEKYADLIERHPSVGWWLYLGLGYSVHNSYPSFTERCRMGGSVNLPPNMGSFTGKKKYSNQSLFRSSKRSKKMQNKITENTSTSSELTSELSTTTSEKVNKEKRCAPSVSECTAKFSDKENEKKPPTLASVVIKPPSDHPFKKTSFFTQENYLFNFGKICKYVVPTEFAGLFMSVTPGMVTKYKGSGSDNKTQYKGVQCNFDRRFVGLLKSVSYKDNKTTFHNIMFLEKVQNIIQKMTGCNFDASPFSISKRQTQYYINGENGSSVICAPNQFFDTKEEIMFALPNSLQGFYSNTNHFSLSTFSDLIYMPGKLFDAEKLKPQYLEMAKKDRNERRHHLFSYYKQFDDLIEENDDDSDDENYDENNEDNNIDEVEVEQNTYCM